MKPNKKLITLLVFLLLAFVGLNLFLISKYKAQLSKPSETKLIDETKKAPFPHINTFELPPAEVGTEYRSEVFASLSNANEDLTIKVDGLPEGLTLGKCSQEFNTHHIPTPNTQKRCIIEGVPTKDGLYQIKVSVTNKNSDGYNTVENTVDFVVTP